ncbi:MAG TPA: DUF3575 domain-containing protein [Prolixibacteraceae bacterium]|nr:DUF3575 domain-containing protein [Prolixibacteraceae bacterium]
MFRKNLFYFLLLTLVPFHVFSQKNILKTNVLGWTWGKFNLQYERMLSEHSSASISYSYIRPYFAQIKEYGLLLSTFDVLTARFDGHEVVADFRLYNPENAGPRGFYIGPYLRYNYLGLYSEFNNPYSNLPGLDDYEDFIREGFDVSRVGLGLKLGAHWILGDHFSIDWNFFGLGIDSYTFHLFFEGQANLGEQRYSFQDQSTTRFFLSGISTDLTLGWAF